MVTLGKLKSLGGNKADGAAAFRKYSAAERTENNCWSRRKRITTGWVDIHWNFQDTSGETITIFQSKNELI